MNAAKRRFIARLGMLLGAFAGLIAACLLIYNLPFVHERLFWRVEILKAEVRAIVNPQSQTLPTPIVDRRQPTADRDPPPTAGRRPPIVTATDRPPSATETPTPTATPLPSNIALANVPHEYQGWNNCGPATLAMALGYWDWTGDQYDAAEWLKPDPNDKNVRPDEMAAFVNTQVAPLEAVYRVGGTLDLLQRLIANGNPVIIAKGLWDDEQGWIGHYVLVTGYHLGKREFITQDSLVGPDRSVTFEGLDADWQDFNRTFAVVYPDDRAERVMALLGEYADETTAYQIALDVARAETQSDPGDMFAWHNLGANLTYFGDFGGAAAAFDQSRTLGLPARVLWYQHSLYRAYYEVGRYDDVNVLASIMLEFAGGNVEESLFWRGKAKLALGDARGAERDWQEAVEFNVNYQEARQALETLNR